MTPTPDAPDPELVSRSGRPGHHGLILLTGRQIGRVFYLTAGQVQTVGRDPDAEIWLTDDSVSARHARVSLESDGAGEPPHFRIVDLRSTNGILVNGRPTSEALLRDGDRIRLGDVVMKFAVHDETEYRYHLEIQRRIAADDQTGLLTVSSFYERLLAQLERSRRNPGPGPVIVAMMDVDRLRDVNEAHGHGAGSFVLKVIGALLLEELGDVAELGRYGGDEFIAFLPELRTPEALARLESTRRRVAEHPYRFEDQPLDLSLSIGVASHPRDGSSVDELVRSADAALAFAKQRGRNRMEIHDRGRQSTTRPVRLV